jgi:hypothetical protein
VISFIPKQNVEEYKQVMYQLPNVKPSFLGMSTTTLAQVWVAFIRRPEETHERAMHKHALISDLIVKVAEEPWFGHLIEEDKESRPSDTSGGLQDDCKRWLFRSSFKWVDDDFKLSDSAISWRKHATPFWNMLMPGVALRSTGAVASKEGTDVGDASGQDGMIIGVNTRQEGASVAEDLFE